MFFPMCIELPLNPSLKPPPPLQTELYQNGPLHLPHTLPCQTRTLLHVHVVHLKTQWLEQIVDTTCVSSIMDWSRSSDVMIWQLMQKCQKGNGSQLFYHTTMSLGFIYKAMYIIVMRLMSASSPSPPPTHTHTHTNTHIPSPRQTCMVPVQ